MIRDNLDDVGLILQSAIRTDLLIARSTYPQGSTIMVRIECEPLFFAYPQRVPKDFKVFL